MKVFRTGVAVRLSLITMAFAASCVKIGSPIKGTGSPNPANNSFLSSIGNSQVVDSFKYDNSNRITSIQLMDTGNAMPGFGSIITFSYAGNAIAPASYTISSTFNSPQLHLLFYDGQNRIIKDSTPTSDGSEAVTTWAYPNGNIVEVATSIFEVDTSQLIDTLFVNNGNISAAHSRSTSIAGQIITTQLDSIQFTYTTTVNPCFHQTFAATYGPLLNSLAFGYPDFISAYGIRTATTTTNIKGSDVMTENGEDTQTYTWTTDNKGRASLLKVTNSDPGVAGFSVGFSYY
jgi:hypothetical protein